MKRLDDFKCKSPECGTVAADVLHDGEKIVCPSCGAETFKIFQCRIIYKPDSAIMGRAKKMDAYKHGQLTGDDAYHFVHHESSQRYKFSEPDHISMTVPDVSNMGGFES